MKFGSPYCLIITLCFSAFLVSCDSRSINSSLSQVKDVRPAMAEGEKRPQPVHKDASQPVMEVNMPSGMTPGKGVYQIQALRYCKPSKTRQVGKTDQTGKKLVALTFDDGPDNLYTPKILDLLKQEQVKATFYVIGIQTKKYPQVVKRIGDEGHAVGIHTWSHVNLNRVDANEAKWQVEYCAGQLKAILGYTPNMVRPPFGSINGNVLRQLNKDGFWAISWSVDTKDWRGKPVNTMMTTVQQELKPGGIILMHSAGSHSAYLNNSIALLPQLITNLKQQGYTFVTVPELYKQSLSK